MPKVYIDGTEYEVEDGKNMLQVVLDNKLDLPYFCWHPAMGSVGACRQCAVKVFKGESDTQGKIAMACTTPAVDGTRISLSDPEAMDFRKHVIEWLMINHPHDCPVCDEGGECHLQDMTAMTGHVYRRYHGRKRTHLNQDLGPFVNHEMNRCIQCYRCVRFYRDYAGGRDLNVFASHDHVYFGRDSDGVLESEFSGNLVEVCPTGVFTDKTFRHHYTRRWDLKTAPSICIHCGLGCNTTPGARNGQLRRVHARYNSDVNGYFLCDRGRYGYEFVNGDRRIRGCLVKDADERKAVSWDEAIERARAMLRDATGTIGIGSPRASLEANYALRKLVGDDAFSTGLSGHDHDASLLALRMLQEGQIRTPALAEVESADAVLILGVDPTNESPMLDLAIRQGMRNARLDVTRKLKIPDWDAVPVAFTLQGEKGPLFTAVPWGIKLEEIAEGTVHAGGPDLVDLAEEICRRLRGESHGTDFASTVARSLSASRQPLVVTGISAGEDVLAAAYRVAEALHAAGKDCLLTVIEPEANTVGVTMIGGMSVGDALRRVELGEADTVVVLENDLSRRADPAQFRMMRAKVRNLIVLDCIETATSADADIVLPTRACVESDGTFVNNEGRAQGFLQVFTPPGEARPAWAAIQDLGTGSEWAAYQDVLRDLASSVPIFEGALDSAPLTLKSWWPGWNSVNSVTKFQIEVNGPLQAGNPGRRLIEPAGGAPELPERKEVLPLGGSEVRIVPRACIFGSEETSRLAPGIATLTPQAALMINPALADTLGIAEGQAVEFGFGGGTWTLPVRTDASLPVNVATVPANLSGTIGIVAPIISRLTKA